MGKKINPKIFRLKTAGRETSRWYASKQDFPRYLEDDVHVRDYLKEKLRDASLSTIEIKRSTEKLDITIYTAKPGIVIGRGGAGIEEIKKDIKRKYFGSQKIKVNINIQEVRKPDLDANVVMSNIITQIEKRIPFRRVMKRTVEQVRRAGAKGVKIMIAGRLNGVEIARTETLVEGSVPSQTLRADIDYTRGTAKTIYGALGVKVWIYKGIVFDNDEKKKTEKPRYRKPNKKKAPVKPKSKPGTKKVVKKQTKK